MKKCLVKSCFNPISYFQLNQIKSYLKKGYNCVDLVCTSDNKLLKDLVVKLCKPYKKIRLVEVYNEADYDLIILDNDQILQHMQSIRYGNYTNMPYWMATILNNEGIYYQEMLHHYLKENRYNHSVSVANVCVELANCHGLDTHKAYVIGMLHDICKNMDEQTIYDLAYAYDHNLENIPKPTLHAQAGATFIKCYLRIYDRQIIQAIANHSLGNKQSLYTKCIFIADKADPSRGYDSTDQINLAKKNLTQGYLYCKEKADQFLKNKFEKEKSVE